MTGWLIALRSLLLWPVGRPLGQRSGDAIPARPGDKGAATSRDSLAVWSCTGSLLGHPTLEIDAMDPPLSPDLECQEVLLLRERVDSLFRVLENSRDSLDGENPRVGYRNHARIL